MTPSKCGRPPRTFALTVSVLFCACVRFCVDGLHFSSDSQSVKTLESDLELLRPINGTDPIKLYFRVSGHNVRKEFGQKCDVPCVDMGYDNDLSLRKATAVIYHLPGLGAEGPTKSRRGQVNIGYSMEPTEIYPHQAPAVLRSKGFIVATTSPESSVQLSYITVNLWKRLLDKKPFNRLSWKERSTNSIAFVASNCAGPRSKLVSQLAELGRDYGYDVHSLGTCAPTGTIPMHKREYDGMSKLELLRPYRMYLAFENSVEPGYVTEKAFDGYTAGCVNVYHGAPDIDKYVPPNSLIKITNGTQSELKGVAEHISKVLTDKHSWDRMMAWRKVPLNEWDEGKFAARWGGGWKDHTTCRMCRLVCARIGHPACAGRTFDPATQQLITKEVH